MASGRPARPFKREREQEGSRVAGHIELVSLRSAQFLAELEAKHVLAS